MQLGSRGYCEIDSILCVVVVVIVVVVAAAAVIVINAKCKAKISGHLLHL